MKNDGKENLGALGGMYGHAVTAVLRRLGREGVSTARAKAIMAARKIKMSDTTISIHVNAGRNKDNRRGEPADLTAAQVKELVNAAPDPAKVEAKKNEDYKK